MGGFYYYNKDSIFIFKLKGEKNNNDAYYRLVKL